jgi:hypothetical protein
MKSKVLATIFGKHFLTSPEYDTVFWLSCATVKEGGLGLSFASHIAKSAFVTSMIEYDRSSNILNRIYDLIHHYGSNNPLFVLHSSSSTATAAVTSALMIDDNNNNTAIPNDTSDTYLLRSNHIMQWFLNVHNISNGTFLQSFNGEDSSSSDYLTSVVQTVEQWKAIKVSSLQHYISDIIYNRERKKWEDTLSLQRLSWYNELKCSSAGEWLNAVPKNTLFSFDNDDFAAALCYRYLIKQPMHIDGISCNCHIQPLLDDFGHHLACGCKDGRTRIDRHDLCVIELEKMIRHAGLLTKREERGLFASVTQSVVKENRPDISILNPIISGSSRDLIDVAITGAMGGSEHGVIQPPNNRSVATEQGRQAHQQTMYN